MTLTALDQRLRAWNTQRQENLEIARTLPEALDLLILVMQAGLDFQVALAHFIDSAPRNALWKELSVLQTEIRTGVSRLEALRHMVRRVQEPSLQETGRTLIQGLELGSSLTPNLKMQAKALRQKRAFDAEKRAAVAPLKLMFPLLVFIFPTLFVILFTPIYIQMRTGSW